MLDNFWKSICFFKSLVEGNPDLFLPTLNFQVFHHHDILFYFVVTHYLLAIDVIVCTY